MDEPTRASLVYSLAHIIERRRLAAKHRRHTKNKYHDGEYHGMLTAINTIYGYDAERTVRAAAWERAGQLAAATEELDAEVERAMEEEQ